MRPRSRGAAAGLAVVLVVLAALAGEAAGATAPRSWNDRVAAATRYLDGRAGDVSFAAVDERGRLHGYRVDRPAKSASVLKAMLLVTYLNEPSVRDRALTSSDRALLEPMIRWSDNTTATRTLHIVGAGSVGALARRAGMTNFELVWSPWGYSQITARDQARFFHVIDRLVPARHRAYALRLLATIVVWQRWGVGQVPRPGWNLYFKGGWGSGRGLVDHQVALLEAGGERISAAVLTRNNPSHAYGNDTLRGVFARLFAGLPRPRLLGGTDIASFAYDDGRAAWLRRGCERVHVRTLATGRARSFATSGTCESVGRIVGLTGGRAYWTRRIADGTRLLSAALSDPVVRLLALYPFDGSDGDVPGAHAGDEGVFALGGTTWIGGSATSGWFQRFVWRDARNTCPAPARASLAVAGPLVAAADDVTAEVRDGQTCALLATVSTAGTIRALALGNGVLALLVEGVEGARRISRFDVDGGALLGRSAVPAATADRLDLARGRVAYHVENAIRVLDLATGTSRTAWKPARAPVGLSLEGRTLAWAENRNGRARVWTLELPE